MSVNLDSVWKEDVGEKGLGKLGGGELRGKEELRGQFLLKEK